MRTSPIASLQARNSDLLRLLLPAGCGDECSTKVDSHHLD
jgi:hypothetical protein